MKTLYCTVKTHKPADRRQQGTKGRGAAVEAHLGDGLAAQGAAMSAIVRAGPEGISFGCAPEPGRGVSDKKDCSQCCHDHGYSLPGVAGFSRKGFSCAEIRSPD